MSARRLGGVHFFSKRVGVGVTSAFTGRCSGAPSQLAVTRDGGYEWAAAGVPLPVRAAKALDTAALVATSIRRVWLLAGRGQVFSTANGGQSWRIEPLPTPVVQLALTKRSIWALSCVARRRLCQPVLEHASSAGGGWARVALPRLSASAIGDLAVPSTRVVAVNVPEGQYGLRRELLISNDGGRRWTSRRDPRTPGREPMESCVGPITITARDWWLLCATAAGMNHDAVALERTTDGGRRWSAVSSVTDLSAPIPRGAITPLGIEALVAGSPTRLWLATTVGPVFESADAGARWTLAQGVNTRGAIGVSFDVLSATTAWMAAPGTGLWRTTDGRHWRSLNAEPPHVSAGLAQDATGTAPCAQAELSLFAGPPVVPQTGEHGREFALTNRSAHACRLFGYPDVVLYHGTRRLDFRLRGGGGYVPAIRPRPVLLTPGGHAYFLAAKYRCDGRNASRATSIHMQLAPAQRDLIANIGPSSPGHDDGASIIDYCQRYPGDTPVDPGNYFHVSPLVSTESALNHPPTHSSDTSGKRLP